MQELQPHKSEYWLFPKIENWEIFIKRVAFVCSFILLATKKKDPNLHVISTDEKTCVQAIERYESQAPQSKGGHRRKEFEYIRHGTTTLIAAINVENGKLINAHLQSTRNETDYANFLKETVNMLPSLDKIVVISDQLNTHMSETLVRWIAEEEGYDEDFGKKGKYGILHNMQSRREFLENEGHRIRLIFTPKHCSWLNPIENWFAKLQRHVITGGNFKSVKELEHKIKEYIVFYNNRLTKVLKWKFKGFLKVKILQNVIVNN
jgi:transposase-like protein